MIDRKELLKDLQGLLRTLEADLLERSESSEVPEVGETLRGEYVKAQEAERTAQNYEDWRSDYVTQIAAAWVLSCVFVRFLEDNKLVDPPKLSGPGERLGRARDEHELYFRSHPTETDREYLLAVFDELAKLPGAKEVFGGHNLLWELPNWLSGDAAGELLEFFQRIDADAAESNKLIHDFTDPDWDTRFLGDLYQDLSEAARKKYALLQTPEFVEEFILDRTLDPALQEFAPEGSGLEDFRMIDPACGSGHFLLGAFGRLLAGWQKKEPGTNARELAQRALDGVYGVDLNPYAIAVARFRLLLAAMQACGFRKLTESGGLRTNLACGDSLLHGEDARGGFGWHQFDHVYRAEDAQELLRILRPGHYHAVVANPPYITPKDRALNQAYRERYSTCHMKYSLAVPFMQRLFQLAVDGYRDPAQRGGFVGQITANSFMKREFGKKLIEQYFAGGDGAPGVDLTHVIDTSGAYIPGHGTPTVILFGRSRAAVCQTIRTAMGIRGEPATPADPSRGLVWSAIIGQLDQPGSQSEFVSVGDSPREAFHRHPWSIGGGGAAELKEQLDQSSAGSLGSLASEIGFMVITGEDNVLLLENAVPRRHCLKRTIPLADGEVVRDWQCETNLLVLWPNDDKGNRLHVEVLQDHLAFLWDYRTSLRDRKAFGVPVEEKGIPWWAIREVYPSKLRTPLSIVYAEVATHNHFVLDRGGKVFKQTAPVIKLPPEASEDDHLALLGLLNSSTACFWMKQVCHQKQMMGGDGIRIESKAKVPYALNATAISKLPVPTTWESGPLRDRLLCLTREMDATSSDYAKLSAHLAIESGDITAQSIRDKWAGMVQDRKKLRSKQVLLQEEIDFTVYCMFGLVSGELLGDDNKWSGTIVTEGERPFCIVCGHNEEGFAVPDGVPTDWPLELQDLWNRRIGAIRNSRELRLIESSMYKRRWIGRQGLFNHLRKDNELADAAKRWLTERLESYFDFDGRMNEEGEPTAKVDISLISTGRLADVARQDADFMQVGELYRDDPAFDVQKLVDELVKAESVPPLPVLHYKPAGLRKRAEWEKTWELQRREDAGEDVGDIPVPPKYKSSDFISTGGARYWALRGKLDVPKERWLSFPHCDSEDGTPMIGWAGYDHLQLARTVSAYYVDIQERLGGRDDPRLVPLLACLIELLPWLKQWHNEVDPEFQMAMGDYFEGFIQEEARKLGKTIDEVKAWEPPKKVRKKASRKKKVAE